MATGSYESIPRDAAILISVAVVLSALLQLLVFEQYGTERLATLAAILVGYGILVWTFLGGYANLDARYHDWRTRRHIQLHPEMVVSLRTLVARTDEVLGERRQSFSMAAQSVVNEWDRVATYKAPGGNDPFSVGERAQRNQASYLLAAVGRHASSWPITRNTILRMLDTRANRDGLDFSFSAELLGNYISTIRSIIAGFTLAMEQAGASKLSPATLAEWSRWAMKVNALLDEAEKVAREAPEKTGYAVTLTFERIDENLGFPSEKESP